MPSDSSVATPCGRSSPHARAGSGRTTSRAGAPGYREVRLLARIDPLQLPIDAEEIEAGGERQPEVARALHGEVAGERERGRLLDLIATREGLRPREDGVLVGLRMEQVGIGRGRRAVLEGARRLTEPREAVEAVVPVVVARYGEQDTRAAGGVLLEDAVPRLDEAARHLEHGGDRIREVAAEEEDVAARKDEPLPFGVRILDLVFGDEHPSDRLADGDVVAAVGDEVDPDVAAHGLGERPFALRHRLGGGAGRPRADDLEDAPEEDVGRLGDHPLPRVDVLGGDDRGHEMPEMPPEGAETEPGDRPRLPPPACRARATLVGGPLLERARTSTATRCETTSERGLPQVA